MKFSYNFLQSFFKEKIPSAEKLAEILTMHFFEVESVEKVGDDFVLEIDVLPSRAGDCFSHIGVAREIAAVTGLKYESPEVKIKENGESITERVSVEVRSACSRYTVRAVDNLKVAASPAYIQKRLKTCGIKPINSVVDVANYVMIETGQPLHAFDADKLEGKKLIVRYAKKREKIVTLDEKRYELQDNILVIADELSPIGIAGIKGGIVPEVDKDTKTIYLEAANFDPLTIRRGSQALKIRTDASLRFEHGISPELTQVAINRAAAMIADIAGGKVVKGTADYYPEKEKEKTVTFDAEDLRKVLGTDVPLKEIERILRLLEFKVQRKQNVFTVNPPWFRQDVIGTEDVTEEVGRIYGYENIEACSPKEAVTPSGEINNSFVRGACRDLWKSFGFNETYNYSFVNEVAATLFNKETLIEMEKPVSLEFKYLRPSLLAGLLRNLAENEKNYERVRVFEIGKVFFREGEGTKEAEKLAVVTSADDFYEVKGKIDLFLKNIFKEDVSYTNNGEGGFFNKNRSAKIIINSDKNGKEEVGVFGEVSPSIKEKMKIKSKAVIAELDFEKIKELYQGKKTYQPIFRFPSSTRDVAVLVPQETVYADVAGKITKEGGKWLKEVVLFDLYQGKEIPKGMKSFALRLLFRAENKTLSSDEVNQIQEKIIKALDGTPEWEVRKQ